MERFPCFILRFTILDRSFQIILKLGPVKHFFLLRHLRFSKYSRGIYLKGNILSSLFRAFRLAEWVWERCYSTEWLILSGFVRRCEMKEKGRREENRREHMNCNCNCNCVQATERHAMYESSKPGAIRVGNMADCAEGVARCRPAYQVGSKHDPSQHASWHAASDHIASSWWHHHSGSRIVEISWNCSTHYRDWPTESVRSSFLSIFLFLLLSFHHVTITLISLLHPIPIDGGYIPQENILVIPREKMDSKIR